MTAHPVRGEAITVLAVDDDPDHCHLIQRRLRDSGVDVMVAGSGEAALELLDGGAEVDLALVDYRLPGMNGLATLREIRRRGGPSVVMVTGSASETVVVEALRAGAIDYLVKDPGYLAELPSVVQRAWRHHDMTRRAAELQRLALLVTSAADRDTTFAEVLTGACWLLRTDGCALYVLSDRDLAQAATTGELSGDPTQRLAQARMYLGQRDVSHGPEQATDCLFVPLPARSEGFVGVLSVSTREPRFYSAEELELARAFAAFAGIALTNLQQALHDPLTALPNRLLLMDRLHQALARTRRQRGSVAVLFLDLDRFKVINDSLGHDVGDQALIAVAQRLQTVVRPSDTVARLGGDEFVVLCEDIASQTQAIQLSQRIEAAVAAPDLLRVADTEVVMSASIGIAIAGDDDRPQDVLRNADTAMYRAKQRRGARYELFDDSHRQQAVERMRTESALRQAIEHGRLRLLYQPIVDLGTGGLVGVEALVRYNDPHRGLVPPAAFLDVAEDSGLIVPIGGWALAEACRQPPSWRQAANGEPLHVAVNLSTRQLVGANLVATLEEALAHGRLPAGSLWLEITESVLMEATSSTWGILDRLKDVGPQLGIDDFGTGYSSLTYLRRFPVDFVKIDRSFVNGLGADSEDTAIVTAVIQLGKALGLRTVAEGVETAEQLALLRELDCDLAQGYYFARPQPAEAVSDLLVSQQHW
jgi:diguanylate cyclase (GGDEF)-like protein